MIITSKDNSLVKEIRKLKDKKYRNDKFVVEGIKMLKEAIDEKCVIDTIVIRDGVKIDIDISKYNVAEVSESVFESLTDVVSPQGVLVAIKKAMNRTKLNQCGSKNEENSLEPKNQSGPKTENKIKENNLNEIDIEADYILALDGIQDPGNLGTIIRTADSANLKQIIVSKNTVDAYSPKVVRSTMGAIYRVNIIEVENLAETLNELKTKGFETVVTSLDTKKSIYDINYSKKIVVIGNEANGVSLEVQAAADEKVKIPMIGKTESLNASVACRNNDI